MSRLKQIAAFGVAAVLAGYTVPTIAQSVKKPAKVSPTEAATPVVDQSTTPMLSPIAKPEAPSATPTMSAPAGSKPVNSLSQTSPGTSDQPASPGSTSPSSPSESTPGRAVPGDTPSGTPTNPADVTPGSTSPVSPTNPTPSIPQNTTPSTTPDSTTTPGTTTPSTTPDSTTPGTTPTTPDTTVPTTPSTTPDSTTTPSTPSAPATTPTTPTAPTTPSEQSSAPGNQPTAKTMVLDNESITGVKEITLPGNATAASKFTLPIETAVVQEASVTSDTPITDKNSKDLAAWGAAVSACLQDKPAFVRVVEDQKVPYMVNGAEGKIRLNANGKPVCAG